MINRPVTEETLLTYRKARAKTCSILQEIFTKENALTLSLGLDRAYNLASVVVGLFTQLTPESIQEQETCENAIKRLNDPSWLALFVATIFQDRGIYDWFLTFSSTVLGFSLYFAGDKLSYAIRREPLLAEKTDAFFGRLIDTGIFSLTIGVLINYLPWPKGLRIAALPFAGLPFAREIFRHYHPDYPDVPTLHNLNAVMSNLPDNNDQTEDMPRPGFSKKALLAASIETISLWIALSSSCTSLASYFIDYFYDAKHSKDFQYFNQIANMIAIGALPLSMLGTLVPSLYRINNAAACFAATMFLFADLPLSLYFCFHTNEEISPLGEDALFAIQLTTGLSALAALGHTFALHWTQHSLASQQHEQECEDVVRNESTESSSSSEEDVLPANAGIQNNDPNFTFIAMEETSSEENSDSSTFVQIDEGSSRITSDLVYNSPLSLYSIFNRFKNAVCCNDNKNDTRPSYGIQ